MRWKRFFLQLSIWCVCVCVCLLTVSEGSEADMVPSLAQFEEQQGKAEPQGLYSAIMHKIYASAAAVQTACRAMCDVNR